VSIVGSHHTAFQVADLERSLAFYRDLLGFEVVWERVNREEYVRKIVGYPDAELRQALLRFPESDHCLELIDYRGVERQPVDTSPPNPGTAHICLFVRGLHDVYDRLTAAGVRSVSEPVAVTSGPNEGRFAVYMIDPDGFPVELVSLEPEATA
jgi:catechol 2,3-dioxygenase-like lactoylglutathione lyase family enzyme